jgi:photosystem II stability/assembly factor-like uncharacterized protein
LCVFAASTAAQQRGEPEGDDNLNKRRQEWLLERRVGPDGKIAPAARWKAIETMQRMASRPRVRSGTVNPHDAPSSTQWTNIGPQPLQLRGTEYAGRVWGIAIDPGNSSVIYIGTDSGGVWKTTDGGANWTALTDTQPSMIVRSLALAPTAPNTIYAGTASPQQAGILKSTDGGGTWTRIPLGSPLGYSSGSEAGGVDWIAVHPSDSETLFAVADGGILKSSNGGASWTKVYTVATPFSGGPNCSKLFIDSANPNRVYASVEGAALVVSLDGGSTWNSAAGSGSNGLPISSTMPLVGFAPAPSNANIVYAALNRNSDNTAFFYKSTDGGASWTATPTAPADHVGYWPWTIAVHPADPDVVFAGCVALYRSTDGGQTWSDVGSQSAGSIHVDQHPMVFTNDQSTLLVGNDGGIYSTLNPAAKISWNDLNATLSTVLFYPGMSIHPTNVGLAFAGTQDNGTDRYQSGTGWDWVTCGDGGWTAIDPAQPQNVYTTCQGIIQLFKSTNGGSTFSLAAGNIDKSDASEFIPPLVIDPSNPSTLYFGTYRIWQTNDGAKTWTAISMDLSGCSGTCGVNTIAVAPSDGNTVYTGGLGKIYVSQNARSGTLATWTDRSPGLPSWCYITQIKVHPASPQTAYATVGNTGVGHVFKTTNGGASWTNLTANLPDTPTNDIVIDPDIAGTLYLATDIGVFRSVDDGRSWVPLASGLPAVIVNSLVLHEPTRTLRAATYGRGAWDLSVPVGNQVPITIASSVSGAPFQIEDGAVYQAPISFPWTPGAQHTITWLSTWTGQAGARYLFQSWADGGSNPRTITIPSTSSTYTANITAQYQLSLIPTPAGTGQLTASPSSSDGYYNPGTSVQIQATPATGFGFWYFSGGASGSTNPVSVTITGPLSVAGNFACIPSMSSYLPNPTSSDSTTGLLDFSIGTGCAWSVASDSAWLTLSPTLGTGSSTLHYSIAANSGAARTATMTMTLSYNGTWTWTEPVTVNQDAAGSQRATIKSLSPVSGDGNSTVATAQFSASGGYGQISYAIVTYSSTDSTSYCTVQIRQASSGSRWVSLIDDLTSSSSNLPATGRLSVSRCSLKLSSLSVSGNGSNLTLTLAFHFAPMFAGQKRVFLQAATADVNGSYSFSSQQMGTWFACSNATSDRDRAVGTRRCVGTGPGRDHLGYDDGLGSGDQQRFNGGKPH